MSTSEANDLGQISPGPTCRLAVYGTLAPGQPNHHHLSSLSGRWIEGTVRGQLLLEGWGSEMGYPGIVLDVDGPSVDVLLFESLDLPGHWASLDEFEGSGYRRAITEVDTAEGVVSASIYALASE